MYRLFECSDRGGITSLAFGAPSTPCLPLTNVRRRHLENMGFTSQNSVFPQRRAFLSLTFVGGNLKTWGSPRRTRCSRNAPR